MHLYAHQQKIIDEDRHKSGIFLGTGSGKTITTLQLAEGNTIVICPKTQRDDKNWQRALDLLDNPKITNLRVLSKEDFRKLSYGLPECDTLIIDEAHTCLGVSASIKWVNRKPVPATSQLYEKLLWYVETKKPKRIYLVTATPVKSPMSVFAAAQILGVKMDWYEFRNIFYQKLPMTGRDVYAPKRDERSKNDIADLVQRLGYTGQLSDYFDVPEQTFKKISLDLTTEQMIRIKKLALEFPDPLVLLGKKHQVEQGVLSGDQYNPQEYFDNAKVEKILELSEEFPRMIVFARYTAQIESIRHVLETNKKKVFVLDGSTVDKGQVLSEANNTDEYIFIAQSQVSSGWELPHCPVTVFASLDYSIVNYTQALGRTLRANHLKKNLYIHLVTKGGVDEAVYKNIMNKEDFNERIYLKID